MPPSFATSKHRTPMLTPQFRCNNHHSSTHTTVLFSIILTFVFTVYATSEKIGSFRKMHDLLAAVRFYWILGDLSRNH